MRRLRRKKPSYIITGTVKQLTIMKLKRLKHPDHKDQLLLPFWRYNQALLDINPSSLQWSKLTNITPNRIKNTRSDEGIVQTCINFFPTTPHILSTQATAKSLKSVFQSFSIEPTTTKSQSRYKTLCIFNGNKLPKKYTIISSQKMNLPISRTILYQIHIYIIKFHSLVYFIFNKLHHQTSTFIW